MKKQTLICSAMGIGLLFMLAFTATQDMDTTTDAVPENEPTWTGDSWPLKTCPVSKREIVNPKTGTYDGREVRFCCGGCKGKFEQEPAKYLAPADEEIIKLYRPTYPLKTCAVMTDEPLPTDAAEYTDVVYRTTQVRHGA
jgi:YHS domain-containing protein